MTTTPTSGAADLLDLIEAYAKARHRQGHSSYNAQTAAALQAVKDELAAGQATAAQQASTVTNYTTLGAAMRAIRQSIQMIGNPEDECMRAVKRVLRGAVIIVEDSGDEVAAPAAPAQPAAQQPHRSGCTAGSDEECVQRGCGTNCPAVSPRADSPPAPVLDERDDFEKVFPLPSGCVRVGTGYAATGYSNWAAHTHCERWQGWQARAARAPAESVPALDRDRIREIFMAHGFTVKEGQTDLKQYVYDAAVALLRAARAQADSAQEDAALWRWLAEYLVGTRTDLDDEIVASETVNDLRKLVEAAIKQGATQ